MSEQDEEHRAPDARIERPGAVPGPGAASGSEPGTGNAVSGTRAVVEELDVLHICGHITSGQHKETRSLLVRATQMVEQVGR